MLVCAEHDADVGVGEVIHCRGAGNGYVVGSVGEEPPVVDGGEVGEGVLAEEEDADVCIVSFEVRDGLPEGVWVLGEMVMRPGCGQTVVFNVIDYFVGAGGKEGIGGVTLVYRWRRCIDLQCCNDMYNPSFRRSSAQGGTREV